MKEIEFTAEVRHGQIEIPDHLKRQFDRPVQVRVTVLSPAEPEVEGTEDMIDYFLAHPLKFSSPLLTRDQIHDRSRWLPRLQHLALRFKHLILIMEEGNKAMENVAVQHGVVNWASEVRHNLVTTILTGQTTRNIPPELWPLVTAGALLHIESPQEFRRLQELVGPLRGVRYEEVAGLSLGEALMWAVWVSDARKRGQVQRVKLRPSCVRAGGETRSFG